MAQSQVRSLLGGGVMVPASPRKAPPKVNSENSVMMEALRVQMQATMAMIMELGTHSQANIVMSQATVLTVQAQEATRRAEDIVRQEQERAARAIMNAEAAVNAARQDARDAAYAAEEAVRELAAHKALPPPEPVSYPVMVPAGVPDKIDTTIQRDGEGRIRRFVLVAEGHENVVIDVKRGADDRVSNLVIAKERAS